MDVVRNAGPVAVIPPWAYARVLGGATAQPKLDGEAGRITFYLFCCELTGVHVRRRKKQPVPYTYEPILDAMDFDSPHDQLNAATKEHVMNA